MGTGVGVWWGWWQRYAPTASARVRFSKISEVCRWIEMHETPWTWLGMTNPHCASKKCDPAARPPRPRRTCVHARAHTLNGLDALDALDALSCTCGKGR